MSIEMPVTGCIVFSCITTTLSSAHQSKVYAVGFVHEVFASGSLRFSSGYECDALPGRPYIKISSEMVR